MLRFRRLVSGGAGNGPLLGALQPPQPSMGLKHHLCFSQRLLQSPQGKGLIIKKTQMGQPLAADLGARSITCASARDSYSLRREKG